MGVERGERSIEVEAPAMECWDAILDFESYPEWQSAVRDVEVLERDGEGRGSVVETVIDARVRSVRYVLRYHYEPFTRVWWDYVEGDVKHVEGEYVFEERDGATLATYRLAVDPGGIARFVPGQVQKRASEALMGGSVKELKQRVEGG